MLSFRRVILTQSKALVSLASAFSHRMVHSGSSSNFTPEYLKELEGLYRYTRGRWLYNEREREHLQVVYALYLTAYKKENELQRMIFVIRHLIMKSSRKLHVRL